MTQIVALPRGRTASYEVIGSGRPALMFAGGPGFSAVYMNGDGELLSDALCSYLIDPHGSGSSTPPANPADYSAEGTPDSTNRCARRWHCRPWSCWAIRSVRPPP